LKLDWQLNRVAAKLFRAKPSPLGEQGDRLGAQRPLLRLDVRGCETEEKLTLLDLLSFLDEDRSYNPAFTVLNGLTLAIDDQLACSDGSSIKTGYRRPAEEQKEEQEDDDAAHADIRFGIVHPELVSSTWFTGKECRHGDSFEVQMIARHHATPLRGAATETGRGAEIF
jgi:hypothetical protein